MSLGAEGIDILEKYLSPETILTTKFDKLRSISLQIFKQNKPIFGSRRLIRNNNEPFIEFTIKIKVTAKTCCFTPTEVLRDQLFADIDLQGLEIDFRAKYPLALDVNKKPYVCAEYGHGNEKSSEQNGN
ncbi:unnamed protein product [Gordionus sp. m RMFG-2023]